MALFRLRPGLFVAGQPAADGVENAVDEIGGLLAAEPLGDLDGLVDDDGRDQARFVEESATAIRRMFRSTTAIRARRQFSETAWISSSTSV
jgi:hypothetical protein